MPSPGDSHKLVPTLQRHLQRPRASPQQPPEPSSDQVEPIRDHQGPLFHLRNPQPFRQLHVGVEPPFHPQHSEQVDAVLRWRKQWVLVWERGQEQCEEI